MCLRGNHPGSLVCDFALDASTSCANELVCKARAYGRELIDDKATTTYQRQSVLKCDQAYFFESLA
jgi:hypothetical protein